MDSKRELKALINKLIKEELGYPQPYTMTDDEGRMAKQQLLKIAEHALAVASMMTDNTQLESWVQDKISKSEHNMTAIYDYLSHEYKNKL
jgi:hypothetical protein